MIVISPAKRQQTKSIHDIQSKWVCHEQSQVILQDLQLLTEQQTKEKMGLSERLAEEAWGKNQSIDFDEAPTISAIDLYQGDVYTSLDAPSLSDRQVQYMQGNLRVFSALYGILKPLDGVYPYRLEMTTRLPEHAALAKYWQPYVTECLLAEQPQFIFNLASKEYAACLGSELQDRIVDIVIQDRDQHGQFKVIAVKAKRMRGQILRYMIQQAIQHPEQLLESTINGYYCSNQISSPCRLVFRPI